MRLSGRRPRGGSPAPAGRDSVLEPGGPLAAAVCRYATRFHRLLGEGHHIASPLGVWLLLALVAPAAGGAERAVLEDVLGLPAEHADAAARDLLGHPHPAVLAAAAAWRRADQTGERLEAWLSGLAEVARTGPVPSQAEADAWAAEHTAGLIERFPFEIDANTLLVLASALAGKISWTTPFTLAGATELTLPVGPGFAALRQLLRDPGSARRQAIVASPTGALAVHAAESANRDLLVVSVLAAPGVPAGDVLAQAQLIAHAIAEATDLPAYSLFDLPLGAGHGWMITEERAEVIAPDGREERYDTTLPAWSARSVHDLAALPEFGVTTAAKALAALLRPDPDGFSFEAKQVALARYTRTGFEAAAVTAFGWATGAMRPQYRQGRVRTARLEFTRPFAAVAVATHAPGLARSAWTGLPVFSAWITAPDEAG